MYSTAAPTSSSDKCANPPLGGITPDADEVPLIAFATIAGMPWSILEAHVPASPIIGAPATPTSWQILQN